MRWFWGFILGVVLCFLLSVLAVAQPRPRDQIADEHISMTCFGSSAYGQWLGTVLGEQIVGYGVTEKGRLVLFLLNRRTGGFSLLVADPHGRTCILAGGGGWEWNGKQERSSDGTDG